MTCATRVADPRHAGQAFGGFAKGLEERANLLFDGFDGSLQRLELIEV
jgi:hypothetical protein